MPTKRSRVADAIGYPVLFKAENGGGGRGMRIARAAGEVETAYAEAQAEARAAFGGDRVYLEKLIEGGRHVEIQVFADRYGRAVHLGERDCTVQRNHQKLIEESPSPAITADQRAMVCEAAARAAARIGYVGAGTMEMLYDHGTLRFMEMNCRLQVEHTVSEMRTGVDLVHRAARRSRPAARSPWQQAELVPSGHVIECRINAEDPANNFAPAPGTITAWQPPSGDGIRVDTHVEAGYVVPPFYDSLLAKLIVKARGSRRRDREDDRGARRVPGRGRADDDRDALARSSRAKRSVRATTTPARSPVGLSFQRSARTYIAVRQIVVKLWSIGAKHDVHCTLRAVLVRDPRPCC